MVTLSAVSGAVYRQHAVTATISLHAKFEVCTFTRYEGIKGDEKYKN